MSPLGCTATPVGRWSCPGDRPRMPKRLLNCPSLENIYAMNLYSLESELAQKSTEQEKAFVKYTVHQNMPVLFKETPPPHTHTCACAHMHTCTHKKTKLKQTKTKVSFCFFPIPFIWTLTQRSTHPSLANTSSQRNTRRAIPARTGYYYLQLISFHS